MADKDKELSYEPIALTGSLKTSVDPSQLAKGDFQSLVNMRYTQASVKSITGQSKINTNPVLAGGHIVARKHFVKDFPPENHLLVQVVSSDENTSAIYDSTTSIPNQGEFTKLIDLTGVDVGQFSDAPDGCVAFGNGSDLLVWGGNESRCAGLVVADTNDVTASPATLYDYTDQITDSDTSTVGLVKDKMIHIASTRALQGIKFYISSPNTAVVAPPSVYYWGSNGTWILCQAIVDNTVSGGKPMAQTGEISFTNTDGNAQLRLFNNALAYWYLVAFATPVDITTSISHCSVNAAPQPITDIWDGVPRTVSSVLFNYDDYTSKVIAKDYVKDATETYALIPTGDNISVGFTERMRGIKITFVTDQVNSNANTLSVKYWNGSSWASLVSVDGTTDGTKSFHQDGVVYWTPPDSSNEFTKGADISFGKTSKDLFYYYLISFNNIISDAVWIDSITGIPASIKIDRFSFPAMFQNRLVLCNNQSNGSNTALIGGANTSCVFNGTDSTTVYFGENRAINAAAPFFSRFSNNYFENLIVFKPDSVWVVDGDSPETYKTFKIASMNGLASPATLTTCDIGFTGASGNSVTRNILLWQSSSAICMFEGSVVVPIHFDIEDVFDQTKSYAIDLVPSPFNAPAAFFDVVNREWHWMWKSKDGTMKEYVFDAIRTKWFTVDRGTTNKLYSGLSVMDTHNNNYSYGICVGSYVKRLENGTTFDGTAITSTFHTGEAPLAGWMVESKIRKIKPIFKQKTTGTFTLDYYGDGSNTPTKTISSITPIDTAHRLKQKVESLNEGSFVFHSFKCTMVTSIESTGFEPVGIGIFYQKIRKDFE